MGGPYPNTPSAHQGPVPLIVNVEDAGGPVCIGRKDPVARPRVDIQRLTHLRLRCERKIRADSLDVARAVIGPCAGILETLTQ